MGTVRALDAGTLSISRLVRIIKGADLASLTDPLGKAQRIAEMQQEMLDLKRKRVRR